MCFNNPLFACLQSFWRRNNVIYSTTCLTTSQLLPVSAWLASVFSTKLPWYSIFCSQRLPMWNECDTQCVLVVCLKLAIRTQREWMNLLCQLLYSDSRNLWLSEYLNRARIWKDAGTVWLTVFHLVTLFLEQSTFVKPGGADRVTHSLNLCDSAWVRWNASHVWQLYTLCTLTNQAIVMKGG